MLEQKKVIPQTLYPPTLDPSITVGNVERSKVYEPQWINNQTRLNSHNVELMRANLIKYINKVLESFNTQTTVRLNNIHINSAGWIVFDDTHNALGEVFNDYENNSVNIKKRYQAVFGHCNIANGDAQFVCGKFNEEVKDALLIVGEGESDTTRRNALFVNKNGESTFNKYTFMNGLNIVSPTTYENDTRLEYVDGEPCALNVTGPTVLEGVLNVTGPTALGGTLKVDPSREYSQVSIYNNTTNKVSLFVHAPQPITLEDGKTHIQPYSVEVRGCGLFDRLQVLSPPDTDTGVVRKQDLTSEINQLRSEISNALHYIGVTTTELTNESKITELTINGKSEPYTATDGDVVIYNDKEFIFDGNQWYDYSDRSNYIHREEFEGYQVEVSNQLGSLTTNTQNTLDLIESAVFGTHEPEDIVTDPIIEKVTRIETQLDYNYLYIDGGNAQDAITESNIT